MQTNSPGDQLAQRRSAAPSISCFAARAVR